MSDPEHENELPNTLPLILNGAPPTFWLELTIRDQALRRIKIPVQVTSLSSIMPPPTGSKGCVLMFSGGSGFPVEESYADVCTALRRAGAIMLKVGA